MSNTRATKWIWAATLAACLAASPPADGLINPNFTPVELTRESQTILSGSVRAMDGMAQLRFTSAEALKGEASAETMELTVDPASRGRLEEEVFWEPETEAPALIFFAEGGESGSIHIDGYWFALVPAEGEGSWQVQPDRADLMAVWEGRSDMLHRAVEYVQAARTPFLPAKVGASWADRAEVAAMPEASGEMLFVAVGGREVLLVAGRDGDRAFVFDRSTEQFKEVTEELRLQSASAVIALTDANADGRLDLASAVDNRLTVWAGSAGGAFEERLLSMDLPTAATTLASVDGGLVAGSEQGPVRVRWNAGEPAVSALPVLDFEEAPGDVWPAVVADFDGDSIADILQPYAMAAAFYRGVGDGTFEAPRAAGEMLYTGSGPRATRVGDFDGDGRLDVTLFGEEGQFLWLNAGNGRFDANYQLGEPIRIARPNNSGGAVGDLNNDGRTDYVVFYERAALHPFFNRGFSTFGFAIEMDVMRDGFFPEAATGQRGGLLADLTGDGGADLATVLSDGSVWVITRGLSGGPGLGAAVQQAGEANHAGPLRVEATGDPAPVGARSIAPGEAGAWFGQPRPGPLKLRWQYPDAEPRQATVIVEIGPLSVRLGREGLIR